MRGRERAWAVVLVVATLLFAACMGHAVDPDVEPDAGGDAEFERAPDFELELFENAENAGGEMVRLSEFEGDPVVLNFWFPSCPPCVAEMPDFETAHQKFKGDGVRFIGVQLVGLDTIADGQEFVRKLGVNYMLGPDASSERMGGIVQDYGVSGFPTTVFIDGAGNIRRQWVGAINLEKLEEIVRDELLGQ